MYQNYNENSDTKYFRTESFYLSVFLFSKGLELVNIDHTNSKRSKFIFRDTPERELWIEAFNFAKENSSEAMVDVRKLVMAIKMLKDKLYQKY